MSVHPWLLLDIDEGILRRESSLEGARSWARSRFAGQLHLQHAYDSGLAYEYCVSAPGDEHGWSVLIARADRAQAHGFEWAFELPDVYPYPFDAHKRGVLSDDERAELREITEKRNQ